MSSLNIIGGTYLEKCVDPYYCELFGSGLRGAAALSEKGFDIKFHSCISEKDESIALMKAKTYEFEPILHKIDKTIQFHYYHPLSLPMIVDARKEVFELSSLEEDNFLYYGMIEATTKISGKYVVYDPQNHKSFKDTNSTAEHLALILNKKEAEILYGKRGAEIENVGKELLKSEKADVIVIKNGSQGALVFHRNDVSTIPVFHTNKIWPIGSGDIFSAVFAWKWIIEKKTPYESAYAASKSVAHFCESQQLPLPNTEDLDYKEIKDPPKNNKVYLAGPFFTIGERFLINELRNSLNEFGNTVFSPFHQVGVLYDNYTDTEAIEITERDLAEIRDCDVILAVISGSDPGTLYEIGYGKALKKKIVILAENMKKSDLTMLVGSDCIITNDLSTAVYKTSW